MTNRKIPVQNEETAAPAGESKADKFKRLATVRMNNLIVVCDKLEGLANKSIYDYTPEQAAKMVAVIRERADHLEKTLSDDKGVKGGFGF